jgi:glycosyltransferase involved in cell wall biosynthesis
MIFFSIVTPTFNRCDELKRLYSSISKQTFKNFEWIICDGESFDNTTEIIKSFSNISLRFISQNNLGVNAARNLGQKLVNGKFTIYIDSDDEFFDENTLQRIYDDILSLNSNEFAMISYDSSDSNFKNNSESIVKIDNLYNWLCNKEMNERIIVVNSFYDNNWPSYNGYEGIKHYKLLEKSLCYYINRSERIYHQGASNQLSNIKSFLKNANDGYHALNEIWIEYNSQILNQCHCIANHIIIQKLFRALYISDRKHFFTSAFFEFKYLNLKNKILVISFSIYMALPLSFRKYILLKFK